MNKRYVAALLLCSVGLMLWDGLRDKNANPFAAYHGFSMIGAVFALAFTKMLFRETLSMAGKRKIDSEILPAVDDVVAILVGNVSIPDFQKKTLLHALRKSKSASVCGKVSKEVPFSITDRWGGVWNLVAYRDVNGHRGFIINRMVYAGRNAEIVAECVGLGPSQMD